MNAEIIKVYKQNVPALRFIGKKYGENDCIYGMFGKYWEDWFKNGITLNRCPLWKYKGPVVIDDINKIKNNKIIDVILSSVEVGYRKPNVNGYLMLSKKLGEQTK
jgi:hypothetical protein